jgi:hypothetical protein
MEPLELDETTLINIRVLEPCAPMHVNPMPPLAVVGGFAPPEGIDARADPRIQRARELRLAELLLFFAIRNEDVTAAAALLASGPVIVGEPNFMQPFVQRCYLCPTTQAPFDSSTCIL